MFTPIIGTESEYGNRKLDVEAFLVKIERHAMTRGKSGRNLLPGAFSQSNFFGLNGCRFYKDLHQGMEYATPECRTPMEAVIYELAGTVLFDRIFNLVNRKRVGNGYAWVPVQEDAWFMKNNTPPIVRAEVRPRQTYGNHINVQMPIRPIDGVRSYESSLGDFAKYSAALIATLPLVCGSGMLVAIPGKALLGASDYSFLISARSSYIGELISQASTVNQDRPIFLQRNEPWADAGKYWRLQVLSLDANILPSPNLVKLTALQIAAEMWAAGELESVSLADPVQALRRTSTDWTAWHDIIGGPSMTALDIQENYFRQALGFATRHGRVCYTEGLRAWGNQLAAFRRSVDVPAELFGLNDWVTKYLLMKRRHYSFALAQQVDLHYHGYNLGKNFLSSQPMRLIAKFGPPGFMEAVRRASWTAPPTRAQARGRFVRSVMGTNEKFTIDWVSLKYFTQDVPVPLIIKLADPAEPYSYDLENFLTDIGYSRNAA